MSEKSFLDNLVSAWHRNLESEDYDEDAGAELLSRIEEVSPETYEKIKDESGYNDLIG